jgi:heat-inducible transcriptional repressor
MGKSIDFEIRRKAVLEATVNRYIKTGAPVSSEEIAGEFGISSATVRNIFAELERGGYLTHPYTSGGRIPTNKGYRYYVDFLISQMELLDDEKERVTRVYEKKIDRYEELFEYTSEVISTITHYAGIVSFLDWQDRLFYKGISFILEQPEFKDAQRIRLLIKMIEDKRKLLEIINRDIEHEERTVVIIGDELGCPEIEGCSVIVSRFGIKKKTSGRLAVIGPKRMEYSHTIPALEYIADTLSEALGKI